MGVPCRRLILAVALIGLLLLTAAPQAQAAGALTNQRVGGAGSPAAQGVAVRGPASLILGFDSTYDGATPPFTPKMTKATFDVDDDFLITPGATPQCDPTSAGFNTSTTEAALAACGGARLGSGAFELIGAVPAAGISTAFNGTPNTGGVPRIILHLRTAPPLNTTTLLIATLSSSVAGPDFGQSVDMPIPLLAGGAFVFEHLDFELGEPGTPSASTYVTARCADASREWNYAGSFVFDDATSRADTDAQPCTVAPPVVVTPPPATPPTKPKSKKKKKKKKKKRKK
jgi:hypothetical protein